MFKDLNFHHHWTWFIFVFSFFFFSRRCICHLDFAKGDVKKGILIGFLSYYKEVHAKCFLCTLFKSIERPVGSALVAQRIKSLLQCRRPGFSPWVRKISWKRAWQPTRVFLPGEFHGQRSLAGYNPWGRKELDTTERLRIVQRILEPVHSVPSVYGWKNGGFSFKTGG